MGRSLGAMREDRGSALLISLVLILVMTLLGLALLDLGALESRLVLADQTDVRAFEIALAGLERALERLQRTFVGESDAAPVLPNPQPSWADGDDVDANIALCSGGCGFTFKEVNPAYISTMGFNAGTYAIGFKLLTVGEANGAPYSTTCTPRNPLAPDIPAEPCRDLILLRSTGTLAGIPPGYSGSRTVQALVRASSTSAVSGGLGGGDGAGLKAVSIKGGDNLRVHGSIHLPGETSVVALSFTTGTAGQRNNLQGLSNETLDRLEHLQKVCPTRAACSDAAKVESLGAALKVARPLNPPGPVPVALSGGATVGTAAASSAYGRGTPDNPSRTGKGPVDGVLVAGGCVMPCTMNFTSPASVHADGKNITKPYPDSPAPAFPFLMNPTTIKGIAYNHYACPAGSSCFGSADFFVSHAALLGGNFEIKGGTAKFTLPVSFTDKAGTPRTGQICWKRDAGPNLPAFDTLELGTPTCADSPFASAQDPLLVYVTGEFKIETSVNYRGAAIFLMADKVTVKNGGLQTYCPNPSGPCDRKFPRDDMLALLTVKDIEVEDLSALTPLMALLYTGPGTTSGNTKLKLKGSTTQIVGGVTAFKVEVSSGVPQIYEAPRYRSTVPDLLAFTSAGQPNWRVSVVPGLWLRCRPGASPTTPPDATGICGYQ